MLVVAEARRPFRMPYSCEGYVTAIVHPMSLSGGIALDIESVPAPLRILRLDCLRSIAPSEKAALHQRIVARNP